MVVNALDERILLRKMAKGSQKALETAIKTYSAYVLTVVHSMLFSKLIDPEQVEKVSVNGIDYFMK